jgi:UDP:flavonoid glycosyltransferase YjiC (YdhE family)
MFHAEQFFAASAEACRLSGARGILLTRRQEQIPAKLPPGVVHVPYAPFSELLPRCAAVVHHGGIGSSAQALAAGVPQIIQPFAHDQPDNAHRLERLGVARTIYPKQYTSKNVASVLNELLADPAVAASTKRVAAKLHQADALGEACERIEQLAFRTDVVPMA